MQHGALPVGVGMVIIAQRMEKKSSTANVKASGPFRPHGQLDYELGSRVLYVTATGPFNVEVVPTFFKASADLVSELERQGPWGQIVTTRVSAMASLDMLTRLSEMLRARNQRLAHVPVVAIVFPPEVEGAGVMAPLFLDCYRKAGSQCQTFADLASAESWMRTRI